LPLASWAARTPIPTLHEPALPDYLRDLRECVAEVRSGAAQGAGVRVTYQRTTNTRRAAAR